jgi:hypothetical protein
MFHIQLMLVTERSFVRSDQVPVDLFKMCSEMYVSAER